MNKGRLFVNGVGAVAQHWVNNADRQFTGDWSIPSDSTETQIGQLFDTRQEYCQEGVHENKKSGVHSNWKDFTRTGNACCHKDCLVCNMANLHMYEVVNYVDLGTSRDVPHNWRGYNQWTDCDDRSILSGQQCCIDTFQKMCTNSSDVDCIIPRQATQVDGLFVPPRSANYSWWAHGGGRVEVFVAKLGDLPVIDGVPVDISTTNPVAVSPESTSQYYLHSSQRSAPIYMKQGDLHQLRVRHDLPYDVTHPAAHFQVALRTFDPPPAKYNLDVAAPGQYHAVAERVNISTRMPSTLSGGRRSLYLTGVTAETAVTWKVKDPDADSSVIGSGGKWMACDADYVCSKSFTNVADLVANPKANLGDFADVYNCDGCWERSKIECHDTGLLKDGPPGVEVEHSYDDKATDGPSITHYKSKWRNIWIPDVILLSDANTFGAGGPNQNTSSIQIL